MKEKLFECPKCKGTSFNLFRHEWKQKEYAGDYLQVICITCDKAIFDFEVDDSLFQYIEKIQIEEDLGIETKEIEVIE